MFFFLVFLGVVKMTSLGSSGQRDSPLRKRFHKTVLQAVFREPFLDWLMLEGQAHGGQGHTWAGGPELYKQIS